MKNILDSVSKIKLQVTFDPNVVTVLSVLQHKMDYLTNCSFTEHLRLVFSLKLISI